MDLYIDLIWILNMLFDWLVLLTVAWLLRKPFSHFRIVLASLYASMIIPLTFVFSMDWLEQPLVKLLYSVGIIFIAFKFQSIQLFVIRFFSFYFVNFAIGGGLFAVHYLLQKENIEIPYMTQVGFGNGVSWIFVLICFPAVLWFTKSRLQHLTTVKLHHENLYDVDIYYRNKIKRLKGFYDTGNQLTHPFSDKPIMLIDEKTASHWFDSELLNRIKNQSIDDEDQLQEKLQIHYIPLRKAGGDLGFIPVFAVDRVHIYTNDLMYSINRVYVGIHFGKFSDSLSYSCLLHPELLQTKKTKIQHVKGVS